MSMDNIIEVFYHLNKMLIATKHIVDNNFVSVRQRTGTSCIQYSPNLSTSLFLTPTAQMLLVNPTDIRFMESHNRMSMSRESTSLKKSSNDCVKLAKQ